MKSIVSSYNESNLYLLEQLLREKWHKNIDNHEIKKLQQKRFLKLIKYVLTHSKFYGDKGISIQNYENTLIEDSHIINKKKKQENIN